MLKAGKGAELHKTHLQGIEKEEAFYLELNAGVSENEAYHISMLKNKIQAHRLGEACQ